MSTIRVNAIQNTSGVEVYTAKAWVNFNGTGTVAIRASGNVSSITDNGTGDYTVNFTTAMADENYASTFGASRSRTVGNEWGFWQIYLQTVGSVRVRTAGGSQNLVDYQGVDIAIFR
jgi:hypothetical protein